MDTRGTSIQPPTGAPGWGTNVCADVPCVGLRPPHSPWDWSMLATDCTACVLPPCTAARTFSHGDMLKTKQLAVEQASVQNHGACQIVLEDRVRRRSTRLTGCVQREVIVLRGARPSALGLHKVIKGGDCSLIMYNGHYDCF
ncbi:hypothetical protein PoB_002380400 [Plakobranchus ocellatus]|uniref:Uncharacterized protein n=1 Tax=Plakobranchus ocellatus TaxID=259542 RepID=A0AAV3ZTU0_9GAST|nr:hypothetical protein PoB_002380400 [Plakobranchus ocellatus]